MVSIRYAMPISSKRCSTRRKNKLLTAAESACPPINFKRYRNHALDELGKGLSQRSGR